MSDRGMDGQLASGLVHRQGHPYLRHALWILHWEASDGPYCLVKDCFLRAFLQLQRLAAVLFELDMVYCHLA